MTILLAPTRGAEGVEAWELLLRPRAGFTRAYWRQLSADSVLLRWVSVDDRPDRGVMEYAAAEIRGRLTGDTLRGDGQWGSDVSAGPVRPSRIAAPRTTCPAELLAPAA